MKAFLLAAGKGTRLKPFTDRHPKCLVTIHGIPLLKIWIDLLERYGVSDVLINTHHHADQVEDFIHATRNDTTVNLHTIHESQLRGSAGTLWDNRSFVKGESDFVIAYADNLTNIDLSSMSDCHKGFKARGGILTMGLIHAPDPTACGIVTLDKEDRIIKFVEKPSQPESNLANGGVYLASTAIFDYYSDAMRDNRAVVDIGHHLLPQLIHKMFGYAITPAYLKDIGTPQAYQEALAQWPRVSNDIL